MFQWVRDRMDDLLPVPYFHVVFTLPSEFREIALTNKSLVYGELFAASSDTLLTVGRNNLSLRLGFFGVLHTWNQELHVHPHIHYLVPGGGLCTETNEWRALPGGEKFFLPVRVLGAVFCGKFIERLKALYREKRLRFPPNLSHLSDPRAFEHLISRAASHRWVVYAKRPFSGPECVVKYLSGYTHRVGISNSRLSAVTESSVSFLTRNREKPTKQRVVTISHETFVRRFLLHTFPRGFRRIRYFGFLAVHHKQTTLSAIRRQIGTVRAPELICFNRTLNTCCPSCGAEGFRKPHSPPVTVLPPQPHPPPFFLLTSGP